MDTYTGFIARKLSSVPSTGLPDVGAIAGPLFPHQDVLTRWAIARGRAAIFADTGLGKTRMELAWADAVHRLAQVDVLILAPLAVAAQTVCEGLAMGVAVTHCREPLAYCDNGAYWNCLCDCGGKSVVRGSVLNYGSTNSCGCGAIKQAIVNCRTATNANNLHIPHRRRLQETLRNMRDRCYNQSNKRYYRYGARGIKVCDEWLRGNREFYAWAVANGHAPELEIDRIDYDGDYEPSNCRWVTDKVQANNSSHNRRITWNGQTLNISEWAERLGVRGQALQHRFTRGWDVERALTQPFRGRHVG